MLHELRHALGLDHSGLNSSVDSVMPSFAYPVWGQQVTPGNFNDQLAHVNRISNAGLDERLIAITRGDEF